jgi:hypothetical protein
LFAQRVELSASRRLEPIRHLLQRGRRVRRGVGCRISCDWTPNCPKRESTFVRLRPDGSS